MIKQVVSADIEPLKALISADVNVILIIFYTFLNE